MTDSFAPSIGGIERQVAALADYQRSLGHEVTVVTAVRGRRDAVAAHPDVIHSRASRWRTSASPLRLKGLSRRALGRSAPDVVHAHLSVASPLAVHTARVSGRRGIPTALTVHSLWPLSTMSVRFSNLPYWWGPMHGAWSAVGTVAARHVAQVLPAVDEVLVVPNIVDTDWWRPVAALRLTDPSEVRLVTVGRLAARKRIGPLLHVVADVRRRVGPTVDVTLTIVGDGPRRGELLEESRRLGLEGSVRWLGQQSPESIRALLHDSDLFVAPARRESFGIAALEARSAGLPVIGLAGNGLADFIEDGREGLLVEDDAQMAAALAGLVVSPAALDALRETTGSSGPSMSVQRSLDAVDELYARAIQLAGRGRPVRTMDDDGLESVPTSGW